MSPRIITCLAALAALCLAEPALAHEQTGVQGGLVSGLLHPLTGMDHLVAMVAVGIWGRNSAPRRSGYFPSPFRS